jgi:uncharacterized protein
MCGPIVASLTLHLGNRRVLIPQLLYHYGRITTYTVIGGIMGALGSFTIVTAKIELIQKSVMILSGLLIVIMGLVNSGWLPRIKFFPENFGLSKHITTGFQSLLEVKSNFIYYPLGLLLGLIPCGPVYTALLGAARAGMEARNIFQGTLSGMMLMACFGAGTIPALFLTAKIINISGLRYRQLIYKAGSILMIGAGLHFIAKGISY